MPGDIKAVIWDMGGVLLQEVDRTPRVKLAARYGIALKDLYEEVFQSASAQQASVGQITEQEHWQHVGKSLGISAADLADFQLQFWSGDRVDKQLYGFIEELQKSHQTALLSNAWSGARQALTEYYACLDVFDHVIISAEVKLAKPDPAIYQAMLNLLSVAPRQAIFVDDLQENIDAANKLGIHGIRFLNVNQAIADVRALIG